MQPRAGRRGPSVIEGRNVDTRPKENVPRAGPSRRHPSSGSRRVLSRPRGRRDCVTPPASAAIPGVDPVSAGGARGRRALPAHGGGPPRSLPKPSLATMFPTCVPTVRSESHSLRAMPMFVRPSAMMASTSRSRGVSSDSRSSVLGLISDRVSATPLPRSRLCFAEVEKNGRGSWMIVSVSSWTER